MNKVALSTSKPGFFNKLVAPFELLANIESENIIFFTDNNSNNPSFLYFILHESYW
ncbi:hypothetical protein PMIT1313_01760 [Prochlorococcus marinus str. MIT 1313]|nr:hypothetical protein PMIT1313_01760 [Prochlorococcus marinus str. MIT 1313]